jgi:simple sugar transport system ATP-binding protein
MTGHTIAEKVYDFEPGFEQPALFKVENLNAGRVLKDINLELRAGEIVGVTGLLGSGRTELALALYGMLPIESGRIYIDNKPVVIRSNWDAIAHGLAIYPEDRLTEGLFLTNRWRGI